MKKHLIWITLLLASIFVYFGCYSTDNSNKNGMSPKNHSGKGGAQIASVGLPEGWDAVGIIHNCVMEYVDSALCVDYKNNWNDSILSSNIRNYVNTYIKNNITFDTIFYTCMDTMNLKSLHSKQEFIDLIDYYRSQNYITQQESLYSHRFIDMLFNEKMNDTLFDDSLLVFKNDLEKLSWKDDELFLPTILSVAMHSWEYAKHRGKFNPQPVEDTVIIPISLDPGLLSSDLWGAAAGFAAGRTFGWIGEQIIINKGLAAIPGFGQGMVIIGSAWGAGYNSAKYNAWSITTGQWLIWPLVIW